ncbi:unnamed protein product [Effrenium voratum]|nr:unnamed protein product [Effrenium voratum]
MLFLVEARHIAIRARAMTRILQTLFPARADNHFRGHQLALLGFVLIILMQIFRGCMHMISPDGGAQSIATIPLDTYSEGARANIIAMFGQWGFSQLLLTSLYVLVLFRYRSLIPLFYLLFVLEVSGRAAVGRFKPIVTVGRAPGEAGTVPLLVIGLVLLGLSLMPSRDKADASE